MAPLRLLGRTVRGNLRRWSLSIGMARCEANWLAQNALLAFVNSVR